MRIFQKIACIGLFVLIVAVCYVLQDYKGTPPDREKADHPALPRPGGRARLVFAGDLMQHLPQVTAARTGEGLYDYSESFRYVKDIFQKADLAIINLETTLNPSPFYTGYPMFRSPSPLAGAIKDFGVDVAVMANNHVCDNGMTGIEHTIHCLDSLDIAFTGAFADSLQSLNYHPRRLNAGGLRFALFNYTYGTNGLPIPSGAIVNLIDTTKIARDLDRIDTSQTDCAVVFFHWGEEYMRQPSKEQRRLAEFCHQHGAAIVIGSHPHVIQPFETQMDADSIIRAVTVYSLGNFVSNQRDRYKDGGLIVTIDVEKHANEPVSIHPSYTPVWVSLPKYRILPPAVADTFTMSGSNRNLYLQFLDDTRKLLDFNRIFEEI